MILSVGRATGGEVAWRADATRDARKLPGGSGYLAAESAAALVPDPQGFPRRRPGAVREGCGPSPRPANWRSAGWPADAARPEHFMVDANAWTASAPSWSPAPGCA